MNGDLESQLFQMRLDTDMEKYSDCIFKLKRKNQTHRKYTANGFMMAGLGYMMTSYHRQLWADDHVLRSGLIKCLPLAMSHLKTFKNNQLNQSKLNCYFKRKVRYKFTVCSVFLFLFFLLLHDWCTLDILFKSKQFYRKYVVQAKPSEKRLKRKMLKCNVRPKRLQIFFSQNYTQFFFCLL